MIKPFTIIVYMNAVLVTVVSLYLFLAPVIILIYDQRELASFSVDIPQFAFRWHGALSSGFENWARQRVASGKAKRLSIQNIAATEWPVFSSVFYLWSTESLQEAWELDPTISPTMPKEYARGAIEAAAALISDPNHAAWVQKHWGVDYLKRENLFYRMLLISGLTSYQKLLSDNQYQPLLMEQVESLSVEIDNSPYGLLDDYPGQCYPIDVIPAVAAIRRADTVLGTDHSRFVARAIRGFEDSRLDKDTKLPAYIADSKTGLGIGPARGVGISFMLIWARELWPETAIKWYAKYEENFWQQGWATSGIREFSCGSSLPFAEWYLRDVDAGPVIAGYGTAASAFGIGAAKVNGRLDKAYPLSAEALVASWPLLDGTLFVPRMLSIFSDAPYIGEVILLFNFTRRPISKTTIQAGGETPLIIYLGIALYIATGILFIISGISAFRRSKKREKYADIYTSNWMLILQVIMCLLGVIFVIFVNPILGLLILLVAQLFPLWRFAPKVRNSITS
jgi:hypothetical protein